MAQLKFKVYPTKGTTTHPDHQPQRGQQASSLAFINVDGPGAIKNEATKRRIRRHVMKDIGRSRRRHNPLETTSLIKHPIAKSPAIMAYYWGDVDVCINFRNMFVSMDMVSKGVVTLALIDPRQTFRRELDNDLEQGTLGDVEQYTASLATVRRSIEAPDIRDSYHAVVGTIICLAMFDMRMYNRARWNMHMTGLRRVIELAGGVDSLESCQAIRQTLFLADTLGSLVMDQPPWFPQPRLHRHKRNDTHQRPELDRLTTVLSQAQIHALGNTLGSATQLADFLNQKWDSQWLSLDLLTPVMKIVHDVLSVGRTADVDADDHREPQAVAAAEAAIEVVRLCVLALLSTVIATTSGDGRYCASYRRDDLHEERLLMQSETSGVWEAWPELKLWVFVIQAVLERLPTRRSRIIQEITSSMSLLSLSSWDAMQDCLRRVVWVERAAVKEMAQLRIEVEAALGT